MSTALCPPTPMLFDMARRTSAHLASLDTHAKFATWLPAWLEQNMPDGLMVFVLPEAQWWLLRAPNSLERLNSTERLSRRQSIE